MKNIKKTTSKKSIQKVTEIEKLETVKQMRDFLETNPESAYDILDKLQALINKSYDEKLGLEYSATELAVKCNELMNDNESAVYIRNVTYETNHSIIGSFIHNYVCENRCFPSVSTIQQRTGLSRKTVYNHINNGFANRFNSLVKGKINYLIPKALEKLFYIGIQDNNAGALKNFIELSGYGKEMKTTNINNYIQINNLKLSKDEFEKLPNDVILKVEAIISKEMKKR